MLIREANNSDIPAIVSVLKASLGEADLPLSKEIWQFKHENNPFGSSLVFLAEEKGTIAGVRAFMKWQWQKGQKIYSTYRAVDTATHPEFQGQGIFKKLTLKAVNVGEAEGANFVFNTPNDQSRPGYLKMGWKEVNKLKVGIKPTPSFFMNISPLDMKLEKNIQTSSSQIESLCRTWNEDRIGENKFFTPKTREFLKWRFEENPLQKYIIFATENYYIACYVKKRGRLKELRISECIFKGGNSVQNDLKSLINKCARKFNTPFVSFSPVVPFPKMIYWEGNLGPMLTFRELVMEESELVDSLQLSNWSYSLGDLELF